VLCLLDLLCVGFIVFLKGSRKFIVVFGSSKGTHLSF